MSKLVRLSILLALLTLMVPILSAQEVTPEPTEDMDMMVTEEAPDMQMNTVGFRIAHVSPDAPGVVVYINGEPSGIEVTHFPAMTGWVELPEANAQITLVPEGSALEQAFAGPFTLNQFNNNRLTVAVAGSLASDSLRAYVIPHDIHALPAGCAHVTVFNAVEIGMGMMDEQMFSPDMMATAEAGEEMVDCASHMMDDDMDMMATEEADDMMATEEAGEDTTEEHEHMMDAHWAACYALPITGQMVMDPPATEEANATEEAAATEEAGDDTMNDDSTMMMGDRIDNCVYLTTLPAGTLTLNLDEANTQEVTLSEGTDTFIALTGTQIFTYTTAENMMTQDDEGGGDMMPTEEATPETTPES